jgi:hypothetical protein
LQGDFAEMSLIFFVKTQHFSKESGRPKIQQFQMQFPQFGEAGFFPVKVHDQGFHK